MSSSDSASPAAADNLGITHPGLDRKPHDLDDRARQQAALLAFGRRTNAQPPVAVLMEDAAAMAAEVIGADRVGVGEVVHGGAALVLKVAALNARGGLVNPLSHECSLEPSLSMAGYALSQGAPISSPNLAFEKRFGDLFLRKLNLTSALTLPLHFNGKPFGVLGVYTEGQRAFKRDDVQFAETIAHLLTSSVARIRAEEELNQQRSLASTLLDLVDTLVLTLDADGRVVGMNRATEKITGFSIDEVRNRPFWNAFVVPEELDLVQGIFRSSRSDTTPCEFEGYVVAKDGRRRRVSWSMKLMSDGNVQSIILSGIDRTEKIETKTELQQVKEVAERATKALKELCVMTDAGGTDARRPDCRDAVEAAADPAVQEDGGRSPFRPVDCNAGVEQRLSLRRTYPYLQKIAPVVSDTMPKRRDFFEVQCNDISAGGISFFLDRPPGFENLVVALGKEPTLSFFTARVVRVAGVAHVASKIYLVGCRFTGRIRL